MSETTLKSLRLHPNYGEPGYRMVAEFIGRHKIELQLNGELADEIVRLCADKIVAEIHVAATAVTTETLLRGPGVVSKELEHKP